MHTNTSMCAHLWRENVLCPGLHTQHLVCSCHCGSVCACVCPCVNMHTHSLALVNVENATFICLLFNFNETHSKWVSGKEFEVALSTLDTCHSLKFSVWDKTLSVWVEEIAYATVVCQKFVQQLWQKKKHRKNIKIFAVVCFSCGLAMCLSVCVCTCWGGYTHTHTHTRRNTLHIFEL